MIEAFDVVVVAAPQTEDKTRIKGASLFTLVIHHHTGLEGSYPSH